MDEFDQTLIDVIGNEHPETLEQAIKLVRLRCAETDEALMERVLRLESQGRILFEMPPATVPCSLSEFIFLGRTMWYWIVFGLAAAASALVFVVPENVYPAAYARTLFGSIFVLFLPGYSLIRALFDKRELDSIEQFALSVGSSLALVPIASLLLNYTPWGIRTAPVTLSLLGLTLAFSSAAVVRDYATYRKMNART